jgi:hypothetical protein
MTSIAVWLSKAGLALAVAAGLLVPGPRHSISPLPPANVQPATPASPDLRLERAWGREQAIYTRVGRLFDRSDAALTRAQELIDRAETNGKDVAALQSALDDLSEAISEARPIYEGGKGIIAAHKGLDVNGRVVDTVQARDTVVAMHAKLGEIRAIVAGPWMALRTAVTDFRDANPPKPTATPVASGG